MNSTEIEILIVSIGLVMAAFFLWRTGKENSYMPLIILLVSYFLVFVYASFSYFLQNK